MTTDQPEVREAERLIEVVDEYLHWRKVNPHVKGGENYLKRLRDARASNWQPIETAPQDGTIVLVYCPLRGSEYIVTASFDYGSWFDSYEACTIYAPSHWMPLPQPPEVHDDM